jgi:glutamate-ammonia-ligase adenylyltransferase
MFPPSLEAFLEFLPDEPAARTYAERLERDHPELAARLRPETLSRLLVLAANSPWLAETLLRLPEFILWLENESLDETKTPEGIREDLAKYIPNAGTDDPAIFLSRFARREWIRIFLRDCFGTATLAQVTAELSHVADAVLDFAVRRAIADQTARYGAPFTVNPRGRRVPATFAVLALGKLGSDELNYASDIDVMFLASGSGETSGGTAGDTSTGDFFKRVAEQVLKIVGSKTAPEGAAFRVDIRLRPHGQDGPLVSTAPEAVKYYFEKAQHWERIAMVRARGAAGDLRLANRFLADIRPAIYMAQPLAEALRDVRLSKEKIDRKQAARGGGYNVKLGKGGIREIEFIAQALQVCYGGADLWLRAPQTLIALQRLAEKGYLTEAERSHLADAYEFLRLVEHRVQMEHGAQTHSIPLDEEKLDLLARRVGFRGRHPARMFAYALAEHRDRVTQVYSRVFAEVETVSAPPPVVTQSSAQSPEAALRTVLLDHLVQPDAAVAKKPRDFWEKWLENAVGAAPEPHRMLALLRNALTSWAALARDRRAGGGEPRQRRGDTARLIHDVTAERDAPNVEVLSVEALDGIAALCAAGEFFALHLTRHPQLMVRIGRMSDAGFDAAQFSTARLSEICALALEGCATMTAANSALRRVHARTLLDIGRLDVSGRADLREINLAQTALADALLGAATDFARRTLFGSDETGLPAWACLALGRLGHLGMDYGSDLDLIFTYDDAAADADTRARMVRFVETVVGMLGALTADGMLYRVDLRLRPDGRNGSLAVGANALDDYLRHRSAVWERLAYLKVRACAGNLAFGETVRHRVYAAIFDTAPDTETLRRETDAMRRRLEQERAGRRDPHRDFKFGPGGMMDVYFATRFVQIRDRIPDPPEYGTVTLVRHLGALGVLPPDVIAALGQGYRFLRRIDHALRLQSERADSRLPADSVTLARRVGFTTAARFEAEYLRHTHGIRAAYEDILK